MRGTGESVVISVSKRDKCLLKRKMKGKTCEEENEKDQQTGACEVTDEIFEVVFLFKVMPNQNDGGREMSEERGNQGRDL